MSKKLHMADTEWHEDVMLHGWPECGPGKLSLEDLYVAFKYRMELEARHAAGCPGRRGNFDRCDCGLIA